MSAQPSFGTVQENILNNVPTDLVPVTQEDATYFIGSTDITLTNTGLVTEEVNPDKEPYAFTAQLNGSKSTYRFVFGRLRKRNFNGDFTKSANPLVAFEVLHVDNNTYFSTDDATFQEQIKRYIKRVSEDKVAGGGRVVQLWASGPIVSVAFTDPIDSDSVRLRSNIPDQTPAAIKSYQILQNTYTGSTQISSQLQNYQSPKNTLLYPVIVEHLDGDARRFDMGDPPLNLPSQAAVTADTVVTDLLNDSTVAALPSNIREMPRTVHNEDDAFPTQKTGIDRAGFHYVADTVNVADSISGPSLVPIIPTVPEVIFASRPTGNYMELYQGRVSTSSFPRDWTSKAAVASLGINSKLPVNFNAVSLSSNVTPSAWTRGQRLKHNMRVRVKLEYLEDPRLPHMSSRPSFLPPPNNVPLPAPGGGTDWIDLGGEWFSRQDGSFTNGNAEPKQKKSTLFAWVPDYVQDPTDATKKSLDPYAHFVVRTRFAKWLDPSNLVINPGGTDFRPPSDFPNEGAWIFSFAIYTRQFISSTGNVAPKEAFEYTLLDEITLCDNLCETKKTLIESATPSGLEEQGIIAIKVGTNFYEKHIKGQVEDPSFDEIFTLMSQLFPMGFPGQFYQPLKSDQLTQSSYSAKCGLSPLKQTINPVVNTERAAIFPTPANTSTDIKFDPLRTDFIAKDNVIGLSQRVTSTDPSGQFGSQAYSHLTFSTTQLTAPTSVSSNFKYNSLKDANGKIPYPSVDTDNLDLPIQGILGTIRMLRMYAQSADAFGNNYRYPFRFMNHGAFLQANASGTGYETRIKYGTHMLVRRITTLPTLGTHYLYSHIITGGEDADTPSLSNLLNGTDISKDANNEFPAGKIWGSVLCFNQGAQSNGSFNINPANGPLAKFGDWIMPPPCRGNKQRQVWFNQGLAVKQIEFQYDLECDGSLPTHISNYTPIALHDTDKLNYGVLYGQPSSTTGTRSGYKQFLAAFLGSESNIFQFQYSPNVTPNLSENQYTLLPNSLMPADIKKAQKIVYLPYLTGQTEASFNNALASPPLYDSIVLKAMARVVTPLSTVAPTPAKLQADLKRVLGQLTKQLFLLIEECDSQTFNDQIKSFSAQFSCELLTDNSFKFENVTIPVNKLTVGDMNKPIVLHLQLRNVFGDPFPFDPNSVTCVTLRLNMYDTDHRS